MLLRSGDRLARALAVRPLSRIAGRDFDATLCAFARGDDLLLREQAVWALGDRPATAAGIAAVVGAVAGGGHAAVIGQLAIEPRADAFPAVASAIAAELERWDDEATRARLTVGQPIQTDTAPRISVAAKPDHGFKPKTAPPLSVFRAPSRSVYVHRHRRSK